MLMAFYRKFYLFVLSRRYRVTIKGLDLVKMDCGKLILPNHQSHMDPQLIAMETYKYAEIVPVTSERFFKIPIIRFFLKKWGAVSVADFRAGNRDVNVMKNVFAQVVVALKEGKNVFVYPSGELQDTGIEKIRNKQSAYVIVSELPDNAKVIGVRTIGLWGSMFSKAWDGTRPVFLKAYLKGIFMWFANFIFFVPKRDVTFEFVDITEEAKEIARTSDRRTFNEYLEEFYNVNGYEEPTFIKHFFFLPKSKRKLPKSVLKNMK